MRTPLMQCRQAGCLHTTTGVQHKFFSNLITSLEKKPHNVSCTIPLATKRKHTHAYIHTEHTREPTTTSLSPNVVVLQTKKYISVYLSFLYFFSLLRKRGTQTWMYGDMCCCVIITPLERTTVVLVHFFSWGDFSQY